MSRRVLVAASVAVALVLSCGSAFMSQESQAPLTDPEVIELFKQNKGRLKDAAAVLERRGVDFDRDAKVEKRLRKAGWDADAHFALGMVARLGDHPTKAIEEFNDAITTTTAGIAKQSGSHRPRGN